MNIANPIKGFLQGFQNGYRRRVCKRCGVIMVSNDAVFCAHCGQRMERSVPIKQVFSDALEKFVGSVAIILVGLICLAILGCGIYVLVAFVKWCWEHS